MNDSLVDAALTIWTIGHSTRSIDEFCWLLARVAIDLLVDIRSIPRSRTNPQFNREALPTALAATGVGYRHLPELGGLRGPRKDGVASPNTLWRSGAFRNYADYAAANPAFRLGLGELQALARDRRHIAIMCAEAVWWRCHRRIVSDYLLVAGFAVGHILSGDRIEPARLTPGAILQPDGTIIYPAPTAAHPNLLI